MVKLYGCIVPSIHGAAMHDIGNLNHTFIIQYIFWHFCVCLLSIPTESCFEAESEFLNFKGYQELIPPWRNRFLGCRTVLILPISMYSLHCIKTVLQLKIVRKILNFCQEGVKPTAVVHPLVM